MSPTINPQAARLLLECLQLCSFLAERKDIQDMGPIMGDEGPTVYAHLRSLTERLNSFIQQEGERIAQGGPMIPESPVHAMMDALTRQMQQTVEEFSFQDRAILAALTGLVTGREFRYSSEREEVARDAVEMGLATDEARRAAKSPKDSRS